VEANCSIGSDVVEQLVMKTPDECSKNFEKEMMTKWC